jgi:hypothetical protein
MNNFVRIPLTQGKEAIVDEGIAFTMPSQKWQYRKDKNTGYAQTRIRKGGNRKTVHMHRFIWENVHGPIPDGLEIDHINGNGLDNRIANLRLADDRLQSINTLQRRLGLTSSQYPGVNWGKHARKWITHVTIKGVAYHLGCFDDELEAYNAYTSALDAYNTHRVIPKPNPTSSQYKGVSWHKRDEVWTARISIQNKMYNLGYFVSEVDAHNAYQVALNAYNADGTLPQKGRLAK